VAVAVWTPWQASLGLPDNRHGMQGARCSRLVGRLVFSRECMVVIEGYPSLFKGPSYHCPLPEECKQEPGSPKRARNPSELAKLWFRNEDLTQIKEMYVYDNTVLMVYFHHHPNMLLLGSLQYYAF
jgi:hypothetical protein